MKKINETYIFNKGDGNDTIYNYKGTGSIKFGDGIHLEDLAFYMDHSNNLNKLVLDISAYATDNGISINSVADVKDNPDLMNLVVNSWAA